MEQALEYVTLSVPQTGLQSAVHVKLLLQGSTSGSQAPVWATETSFPQVPDLNMHLLEYVTPSVPQIGLYSIVHITIWSQGISSVSQDPL